MKTKNGVVIIPVASGKGGVGKSFIAANLALALARRGYRTVAADLDLGGSNLHHFMGLANRHPGIGDFLSGRGAALERLLVQTPEPLLRFLPGDGRTPLLANLHAAKKLKLMRHLQALPADYLVLDLGAGSALTALDFFGMAERGLTVTTPEMPAIMGMLVFLKNHLLRRVERRLACEGRRAFKPRFMDLVRRPLEEQLASLRDLARHLGQEDSGTGRAVSATLDGCRPRVVFNMAQGVEDASVAESIAAAARASLGIEPDFFGFVFEDPAVRESGRRRVPYLLEYPGGPAAAGIEKLAERVVKYWDREIPGSAALLTRSVGGQAPSRERVTPSPPRTAAFGFIESIASRMRAAL